MTEPTAPLARTPLHSLHVELGAKMVPFAGYDMPVQYPAGILGEHNHARSGAGLFDVSHMGQARLTGADAARALESISTADIQSLGVGRQRYNLFTNDRGGICDDLMVTNAGDHLFVVVNAACKATDIAHMRATIGARCAIKELDDRALLALQGPAAGAVMARLAPDSRAMVFMTGKSLSVAGHDCFVTRSGYTGEDGFEISVAASEADGLARLLLKQPEVKPIGLGARDSLRLEAGLCLYGHDIDEATTPVEADLVWAIGKSRRAGGGNAGGFPGATIILAQLANGAKRKRVGVKPEGRAPAREHTELTDMNGKRIGEITSGGFGPTAGGPVAMGYVDVAHATTGTAVQAVVRGKPLPARVVPLVFVKTRYYRG
ncbi:MAG: glycine cleavage system aminomethyltransferase GcvT [Alphaproteobacteria bacterium]|nr:glycine cleavage system aminomethyltransferase GcvT [Alphaproteobacteria bacterium]